eukprot:7574473-Karenia_brevis.AAC.1
MTFEASDDHLEQQGDYMYNKYLDMSVGLSFYDLRLNIFHPNLHMVVAGDPQKRVKFRYPPPLGTKGDILSRLTCSLMSRRARWRQLEMTHFDVRTA